MKQRKSKLGAWLAAFTGGSVIFVAVLFAVAPTVLVCLAIMRYLGWI